MKQMLFLMLPFCGMFILPGCEKDPVPRVTITKSSVLVNGHHLSVYRHDTGSDYVAVFESGLGDGVLPWREKQVLEQTAEKMSVFGYDRAGYLDSEGADSSRDIPALRADLETLLETTYPGKKYLFVCHSLGALVVRDYAVHHPERTAAMLFVDPTHENYNAPDQDLEDFLFKAFGASSGAGQEARQLIEDIEYAKAMPPLPDKPCTVISSVKTSAENDAADRQKWYDAHEKLGTGQRDFRHLKTAEAGHYVHREAPQLVLQEIETLRQKLQ